MKQSKLFWNKIKPGDMVLNTIQHEAGSHQPMRVIQVEESKVLLEGNLSNLWPKPAGELEIQRREEIPSSNKEIVKQAESDLSLPINAFSNFNSNHAGTMKDEYELTKDLLSQNRLKDAESILEEWSNSENIPDDAKNVVMNFLRDTARLINGYKNRKHIDLEERTGSEFLIRKNT